MTWDWNLRITDVAIFVATFLGPIVAVQLQKYIERTGAEKARQVQLFRTILISPLLSYENVQALNGIKVEFYKVEPVIDAWNLYIDHLSPKGGPYTGTDEKRADLYTDLLFQMSKYLGYGLDKVTIKNGFYSPVLHGQIVDEMSAIRKGLINVLSGYVPLSMNVKTMPVDEAGFNEFGKLRRMLIAWLAKSGVKDSEDGR